ncbi:peptidoglycan DD-metalloendopeptidase family protein [Calothrix sp. CCY 0018]|uniref:peptidoglycan DD-metalloendopeptidase family protein n=1 Tax=Calothrix sp. CCY 0018 TaxID=3103864 RepID=UPI0039C648DF
MTQRKNSGDNNSQSAWQRSLPAQSLCWLGSFSLLSSGFVVAQTSPGIDNIVPTVKTQARSAKKVTTGKAVIISGTPKPESSKPKTEFSQRRAKLREILSVKKSSASSTKKPAPTVKVTTNEKGANTLRSRLKRSPTNSVVVKLKKKTPTTSPRVVIKQKPTQSKPTASTVRVSSPKKTRTILPQIDTASTPKKDYNNALIDPTNYGKKYQTPNSVVITGRKSGCTSVASGQGISGNCGASGQTASKKTQTAKKTTPSWLKASQNASITKVTPSRSVAAKPYNTDVSPNKVTSTEVAKTVLPSAAAKTYQATKTLQRVTSATPNVVKKAVKSVTPAIRSNTASRVASRSIPKQAYSSNRFIPQPSSFTPQTTVSEEAIAPSGGMLSAPIMANNSAPRPSAVAYDIPLASALPKVAYSSPAYSSNYNATGLAFPLSVPSAISSVFGWRQHPLTGTRRFHSGMDLAAAEGTPVLAAYSGQVEISDWVGGYGLTVVLNHNSAQQTLYGHMSELFVRPGQWVERGSVIGRVGSTGNSTGPHLHFETRQLTPNGWVATNPGAQLQQALSQFLQSLQTAQVVEDPGS